MVSAAPNDGKSTFVQNLALEIASGNSISMNKFPITQGRVLYLDLEMGDSALKERFQKMCSSSLLSGENLYVKYIPAFDLLNDASKKLIESWVDELKIEVLIIDPLGNAWSCNESDQEQVGKLTAYLNTLIEKGLAILVAHHWRKATKDAKTGGQMAAGSYKWAAWLDCHITLEGDPHSVTISCHKNRNRPQFGPFLTKINEDSLYFEYITDYQKKFNDDTLLNLFNSSNAERVSIPDLIKRAKELKGPSETTLRKLIEETTLFRIDKTDKTHYLVKKGPENLGWDEGIES